MRLADMRANACVVVLGEIAVEAKDLQIGRESLPLDSRVEVGSSFVLISPMRPAIIIDMIQRQEGRTDFPAAGAFPSIMGQDFFFELFRPPSLGLALSFFARFTKASVVGFPSTVSASARLGVISATARTAKTVRLIFRQRMAAARTFRRSFSVNHWIAIPMPAVIVHRAPPAREVWVGAFGDRANPIHFRSHLIVADARQEIKSWAA